MVATRLITTPDELEAMDPDGERFEVLFGELIEVPGMGLRHGRQGGRIHGYLAAHVFANDLGEVFTSDSRFVLTSEPRSVLAPDVSFIAKDRLPPGEVDAGFSRIVPDLVVEIASPSQYAPELLQRVTAFFQGGVREVWLVRPVSETITIFRPDTVEVVLTLEDTLDGGSVVPGFRLPLRSIFRR